MLVAHHFAAVCVPETEVAGVDAGEDLAHKQRPGGHGQVDGGHRVPQDVDAERHFDLGTQFANDPRHGDIRDRLDLGQIRQAGFVGEHDRVDFAVLQRVQILPCPGDHPVRPFVGQVARVAREGLKVAHGDDWLVHPKEVLHPAHVSTLPPPLRPVPSAATTLRACAGHRARRDTPGGRCRTGGRRGRRSSRRAR